MTENHELIAKGIDFCPFCDRISLTLPKISHLDTKTQICSLCGHTESMLEFKYLFDANTKKKIRERLVIVNSELKRVEYKSSPKSRYLKMIKSLMISNLKRLDV